MISRWVYVQANPQRAGWLAAAAVGAVILFDVILGGGGPGSCDISGR